MILISGDVDQPRRHCWIVVRVSIMLPPGDANGFTILHLSSSVHESGTLPGALRGRFSSPLLLRGQSLRLWWRRTRNQIATCPFLALPRTQDRARAGIGGRQVRTRNCRDATWLLVYRVLSHLQRLPSPSSHCTCFLLFFSILSVQRSAWGIIVTGRSHDTPGTKLFLYHIFLTFPPPKTCSFDMGCLVLTQSEV